MRRIISTFITIVLMCGFEQSIAATCGFPARKSPGAPWSSAGFYSRWQLPSAERDLAVLNEVFNGNIPDRLRQFRAIRVPGRYHGADVSLEVQVAPDYLMIGTDQDFVRVPLTNFAAQYLASELGFVMPTAFLVDQIWAQADVKLLPQPTDWYKDDKTMRYGSNYIVFNNTIETQRAGRTGLIAGHKKDVTLTNLLDRAPARVAIYGWQDKNGHPIQPLGTPHDYMYEDYSHGIRYLGPSLRVFSSANTLLAQLPLAQALLDPELGRSLNGGTPINDVRSGRTCDAGFANAVGLSHQLCPPEPTICP